MYCYTNNIYLVSSSTLSKFRLIVKKNRGGGVIGGVIVVVVAHTLCVYASC